MQKHVQRLLLIAAMLFVPWVTQAQGVQGCTFSTGSDATAWITLSSSATHIAAIEGEDDLGSSCINIGFDFYFGGFTYTQFSCNSNGRLRLGPTSVSEYWVPPFTTLTDASYNDLPFITAFGMDNTLEASGSYVKYELVGTAPNRILVVEYLTPSEYSDEGDLVNYQIQLMEDSNRVRLVYGTTNATYYDSYQIGLAGSATDILMVNPSTHTTFTTGTSTTFSSWPGAGRYYQFTMGYPPACPGITSIVPEHVTVGSAMLSWSYGSGSPLSYEIEYHELGGTATPTTVISTEPQVAITGLDSNTTYVVRVRANCGTDGYGSWDSITFTTMSLSCAEYDPSTSHTFTSGTGTTQTTGVPVNSSWGNTLCQSIYTASELIAAGFDSTGAGITDLTFTWTTNSSYAKYFTIYMNNTTTTGFTSTTSTGWVSTGASAKVYEGAHPLNTTGSVTYHLDTPFWWDGHSNICVTTTMNQPSGATHTSSGFYGYSTQSVTTEYRTMYKYQDSNPLDGSNPSSVSASSRSYYRPNITFTARECMTLATCSEPAVSVDSVSATSVSLSWLPGYQETSWDVQYRVQGTNSWTSVGTFTTTAATITGLTPATYYDLRVLTICGTDTFASMVTRVTDCVPVAHSSLPYTYGFEDLTASSGSPVNVCWNRGYWSGSYNPNSYPYASTSYNHSGSKSLYFYGYGTTTRSWVCLPEFEDSIYSLRLRFWAKKSSASYSGLMQVGVMTDPADWSTFQLVATEQTNATTDWQQFEVALNHAPAEGYITIAVVSENSLSNYMYIDDITVDELPNCIMPIVDSVVVTTNTADFYLSDVDNVVGFTLHLTHGSWDTTIYASSSPISVMDLNPRMEYNYSLVANCGSESANPRTGSFRTECTPITNEELPFSYGFEDIATTGSGVPLAPCWSRGYLSGSSFNAMNYPYASTSYAHSGSKSLYYYGYSTSTRDWLCLPEFEDSINTLQLQFWAKKSSDSYSGVIKVGVMTDPTDYSTFQLVNTLTCTNGTEWNRFDLPLSDAPGAGYITILVDGGGTSSNYIYLDDIEVKEIPTCPHVWNVRVDSLYVDWANISWQEMGTATAWVVEYDTVDFVPGTYTAANSDMVFDTTLLLTNLDTGYTYYFYVRADCSGDTSTYESLVFTTLAGVPATVPYLCTFEGHGTNGWDFANGTQTNYWMVGNATGNGGRSLYITDNGSSNTYTISATSNVYAFRVFDITDTGEYVYSFDWKANGESCCDYMRAALMPGTFEPVAGNTTGWAQSTGTPVTGAVVDLSHNNRMNVSISDWLNDWITETGTFHVTTPGIYKMVFFWHNDGSVGTMPPAAVDNIQLAHNTCPMPTNVTASNITGSSATISWTPGGSESQWIVFGGTTEDDAYSTTYTFTGLQPNTSYSLGVRAVCGGGDTSMAATVSITTECGGISTFPFVEDFESQNTTSSSTANSTFIRCWHHLNNGTSYMGYPYITTSYNHTPNGTKGLYWYGTTTTGTYGDYYYIVLPAVDTDIVQMNTMRIRYWARTTSTSYHPVFNVGVMTDPTDVNTFQLVSTQNINPGSSTSWAEFTTEFDDFTGYGAYIAIRALRPTSSWYACMDDITLDQIPDCPEVSNITTDNVGTTSVDLDWVENGEATTWTIEYGVHGFTRGTGTTETVSTLPHTLSSLTANTAYDVYVTPDCIGIAGIRMGSFKTECEPTATIPLTMSFEASEGVNTGSSTSSDFIECWHRLNNGSQYFGYPYVGSSTTYAHTGSRGLYWYNTTTTGTYGDYEIVVLPPFDVTTNPINTLQLKFWAKASSSSYEPTFQVGVMTNPNDVNTFQQVGIVNVSNSTQWEEFTVGLAGFNGTNGYVAIRSNRASWTAYVDDITLEVAPSCPAVSGIIVNETGTTGALVSWSYQSGFAETPVSCDLNVYHVSTNTLAATYSPTYPTQLVSGLLPGESYKLVVRPVCNSEMGGADSIIFTTNNMPCLIADTTTNDTIVFSTGTDQVSGIFVNTSWGNTFCQSIYTPQELNAMGVPAGRIKGVRLGYSSAGSYNKELTIFMGNTTIGSFSSTSNMVNPSTLTQVYGPTVRANTSANTGWVYYEFTTPFVWDGTSNIILSTFMNQSGSNQTSSGFYGYSTPSSITGASIYKYKDSAPFTITDCLSSGNSGSSTTSRPSITFVTDGCLLTGSCAAPLVVIDSIDTNYIAVSWAAGYEETSWEVEYRQVGAAWTSEGIVTSPGYIFTSLSANQAYEIRISAQCIDTNMATVISARTPCAPFAIPFHENFASFSTSTADPLPSCWMKHTNYSTNYPYASTSYSISGGRSMYMYSTSTSYSYMVLPPFDAPVDTLQVSFWLYKTNTSYTHELYVGVMTDPDDVNTFVQVGSAVPTMLSTWEAFEIPLNSYHGTGQYIAIMSPSGVYSYPYLDELSVEYVSPCPRVRNVSTSHVGLHSAQVSWDTTAAEAYELEYGPAGFAFGTGTRITGLTSDTLTISGLSASTQYDVYVRGLCLPDTGNWSFAHSFYTQCGLIDSIPFFEDFNHIGTGTSIHSPLCWLGTSTYSTSYPYPSNSYNRSGTSGAAMYMYLSNTSGYYTMLQLPEVDTTVLPINTLQVEFSLLRTNTTYEHGVVVGVCTGTGLQNFTPVDTVVVTASTGIWQDFEIPLNNYTGYGSYITFLAYAGTTTTCYPYLDDIRIERVPSCIRPDSLYATNATSTTVQLGWRERGTATSWEIEYGPAGFVPGTGTRVIASTNPTTLTGLSASYQGDFYVRSICTIGDTSLFNREAGGFSTSQLPAAIPYYCNFEDSTEWSAWQTSSNTYINWARGTAEVDSGSYAMYVSPDGGITYGNESFSSVVNAAAFRDVDFGTVDTSFTLTYRAKVGGTISARYDGMMVFVVDQSIPAIPSSSAITSPWGNVNDLYRVSLAYLDTTWDTYVASIDTISGVHRIAFFWFNQNTGASYPYLEGPAAVDNIRIVVSPCARPVNLDTVTVTNTTATLRWDGPASASYRVAYRVAGASASTNVYVNASTNSVTLTGLDPMITYRAWVQKICGSDSSLFSDGIEFQTDMCADAHDIYNFDATMTTTSSSYGPIGYATYNYSYVQTLIDSAHMAGMTDPITAFAFYANNTTSSTYYTGMDVYMANVPEADLSSGPIIPDATTHQFVQVVSNGNFNFTDVGWNVFGFDTTFTWDGHSNVLFAVNRHHGSWSSSTTFAAHSTSAIRTRYYYQDSGPITHTAPSASSSGTGSYVGDLKFISCGSVPTCNDPVITGITHTYESATITWSGTSTTYQVNIKESAAANWPATDITVTGNSYTFTGLQPTTNYTFRVRQDCTADSLGYSDWTVDGFLTDSLPCLAPTGLAASNVTNATATFDWTPVGYETMWDLHVWYSGGLDTTCTVSTHPVTVGGFTPGVTYSASVRPLCGSAHNILGDYGDTITFTTATCPDVTGLTVVGTPTASSVTLSWSSNPAAQSWEIEYGYAGFQVGTGTMATTTTPGYTANGLLDETTYEFHVRAVCGTGWYSENWTSVTATTASGAIPCDAPTGVNTVVAGNSATVSWTTETGNISFEVEYGPHGFSHGGGTTVNATASPITIYNLDYETQYDVYVRANCAENTISAWSIVSSFTTDEEPSQDCDPVSNLAADNVTKLTAHITWTPGATGDAWQVLLTDAGGATIVEDRVTTTDYSFTGLTPGTQYVAKVRTDCGDNQYSAYVSVSFTTQPQEGIDEVAGAQCAIYPNPTSSSATISVTGVNGKVKIAVVDMNGREVRSETLECTNDCEKTMDVESLAQGAYFVRITGENVNMVRKLVVR